MGRNIFTIIKDFFSGDKPGRPVSGFFESTQTQSNERIRQLNLDKASEDASYILDSANLVLPHEDIDKENDEYKADPEKEWIIELIPVNGELFRKKDFATLFDYEWRKNFDSTIYGFSPEENRWTYAMAGGVPETYSKLQVGVNLQDVFAESNDDYDPAILERYITELENRIKKYPVALRVQPLESTGSAIAKGRELVALWQELNEHAIIVLSSDEPLRGLNIWDALKSVGLSWGDGDLFHWDNRSGYGPDQHFSVWTTTDPGYFLPESIKDGTMNPMDLVFGFTIPRCADPTNVFDAMLQAARYCQQRLGGRIVNGNFEPLDENRERQKLADLLKKMEKAGIKPGSDKALTMF